MINNSIYAEDFPDGTIIEQIWTGNRYAEILVNIWMVHGKNFHRIELKTNKGWMSSGHHTATSITGNNQFWEIVYHGVIQ